MLDPPSLRLSSLGLLLLLYLEEKGAVDMREDTTESDCGPDKGVELFVAADGELEMTGGDALDLQILCRIL